MADEVVLTEFRLEVGQYVSAVDAAEAAVTGLDAAEKSAQKSADALGRQLGNSAAKAEAHKSAMSEVGRSSTQAAAATQKVTRSIADLKAQIQALERRRLTLVDPAQITAANQRIAGLRGELKSLEGLGTEAGEKVSDSVGRIGSAAQTAVPPIGGIAGAFAQLLGPVGLAASAIGGVFVSIFKNTDAGATAIEGFRISAGQAFDRITGAAKSFGQSIADSIGSFRGSAIGQFIDIEKAGAQLFQVLAPIPALLGRIFGAEIQSGQDIAKQLDELADKQLVVNEATARNEITIRRNLSALRDTTKPVEERLRLADEITELEERNLRIKREQLREEYRIASLQAGRQQALKGEIDDDLKAKLSGIRTQILDIEAESVSLTERVAARRAGLVEDEEQRKLAAREKAEAEAAKARAKAAAQAEKEAAAKKKAEADEAKRVADTIAAEDAIASVRAAYAAAELSDKQKRDEAVRASFDKQLDIARSAFAELKRLATTDDERAELAKREREAIEENGRALNAELERLRKQDLDAVRAYGASKIQLQEQEINAEFDLQRTETERVITSEEERTALLLEIEKRRADEIAGVRSAADAAERERRAQSAQEVLTAAQGLGQSLIAIDAAVTSNRIADIDARIAAAKQEGKDTSALEREREREQKEAAARAFRINRAFTLAQIAVDTARAISALVAASAANPTNAVTYGAAGAAQLAAGLIQITANMAAAIALLSQKAPGFAQGGEVDSSWGPRTRRSNGDNVVATLQDREIVLSRSSRARAERIFGKGLWGELGVPGFGGSVDWTRALAKAGAASSARDGGSSAAAPREDRRLYGVLGGIGSLREQKRQTELLESLAKTRGRNPRARWA